MQSTTPDAPPADNYTGPSLPGNGDAADIRRAGDCTCRGMGCGSWDCTY